MKEPRYHPAMLIALALCLCIFTSGLPAAATTIHVPADEPTIQAGIDAAGAGDIVLVASGTYYEHDIVMKSGVTLMSESGRATTTIDAQELGRVFYCENIGSSTTIQGFTITGGHANGSGEDLSGGGMYCYAASPSISGCDFRGNSAMNRGGGINCIQFSSPVLTDVRFVGNSASFEGGGVSARSNSCPVFSACDFIDNVAPYGAAVFFLSNFLCTASFTDVRFSGNLATTYGGAICSSSATLTITGCLFSSNTAHSGGAIFCARSSPHIEHSSFVGNSGVNGSALHCRFVESIVEIEHTIIAFSPQGTAIDCLEDCSPTLVCCDVCGNAGGDWVGCIAGQEGVNGNFSEDPLFCTDCYYLQDCSPCVDGYGCGQVGAYGAQCPCGGGPSPVEETTWGRVKIRF